MARAMGWIMLLLLASAPVHADDGAALALFRRGETEFAVKNWDAATALYKQALSLRPDDGTVIVGRQRVERSAGNGRLVSRVTEEELQRAEYFPNRRLDEIHAIRIEEQRRAAPPQLRLEWLSLSEPTKDNVLDGGEKANLAINVENTGGSPSLDVRLEVSATDTQGLKLTRRVDLGTIAANESTVANVALEAERAIAGGTRMITVQAYERDGLESKPLQIPLATRPHEPARIVLSDIQLQDLTGDGAIEPTETVVVTAVVSNVGKGVSNQLIARLDLGKDVVPGPEHAEPQVLGELYPGQARKIEFTFLTNSQFRDDQKIPATLRVVDVSDNRHAEKDLDAYVHVPAEKLALQAQRRAFSAMANDQEPTDVELKIPRSALRRPNAVAVVIGNRNYAKSGLPSVKYALNDARMVKDYFVEAMGVDEHNVLYVEDATAATFNEIFGSADAPNGRLYSIMKPGESDVFVYYSGHGAPDINSNGAFFVPVDVDPSYIALSGYSLDLFYRNLAKLPARSVTVVLDTCFSGNSDGGYLLANVSPASVRIKGDIPSLSNANIFTSTRPQQVSAWYHEKRHGLFTYYFLKGLSGAADADRDQVVTSTELGEYLAAEVPPQARRKYGREQNPVLIEKYPLAMSEFRQ